MFQKHAIKPSFHPFLITREDGSRVYAGAFTFYELIEDESICNAMQSLQTMYDAEYSSSKAVLLSTQSAIVNNTNNSRIYSRSTSAFASNNRNSIKKTTHNANTTPVSIKTSVTATSTSNISQLDDNILVHTTIAQFSSPLNLKQTSHYYNKLKDRLYATKSICLISQHPFNKSFRKILSTLYDMVEQTDLLGMNLESHLYNLIYELPMPLAGKLMQFHIGCRASIVYMPDYTNAYELPIFDYDLMDFFQLLGVSNTINLYITALLEHQILLYSKDLNLLMLVAESLTTLFFPFTWLKPYVPIVPASNLHFIEAPVPYIMGFHNKDIDKEFFKQGQRCFVDIDSGTVTCPEGLPDFPDRNKFAKEINDLIICFNDKKMKLKTNKLNNTNNTSSNSNQSKDHTESSNTSQNENSFKYEILQNSQAFARISELARKAGAFNHSSDEYFGKFKTSNQLSDKPTVSCSSSSGVSSVSSLINDLTPTTVVNNNNSINSVDLSNQTDDSMNSTTTVDLTNLAIDDEELVSLQFTRCIRELFLERFVQMFVSYEKFVM